MRIVFMGTPEFAVTALQRLLAAHEIAAVYTQPPRPAGRGQGARPSAVQAFAEQHGLAVRSPASLKKPNVQAEFAALKADVAVVAAYGLILPQAVLEAPRLGCINIHASLLPRWRGAAPIQRAIMAGDTTSGVTIMQMNAGLDTGAMLSRAETAITDQTTSGELHDVLAKIGGELIIAALDSLGRGTLIATPQPTTGVVMAAKIDKAEARIDFNHPARDVLRHIHGLAPHPGAWFAHGTERIKVLKVEPVSGQGAPGTVLDDRLTIACAGDALRLLTVQRAGKGPMSVEVFLRGYPLPKASVVG
ncbi:MAG: methionyl-tRNA formyltransferase [Rhodospirillaceae bacterium]|nr:methionyl-tRNA formyltransferase [Rhodospirillaceae bacterium]